MNKNTLKSAKEVKSIRQWILIHMDNVSHDEVGLLTLAVVLNHRYDSDKKE